MGFKFFLGFVFLALFVIAPAVARESYGVGKIVKAPANAREELGFRYYLVVKKGSQVGAMPINMQSSSAVFDVDSMEGSFVVFKGNIALKKVPLDDTITEVETISFSKLKKLTLASLRPKLAQMQAANRDFHLDQGPRKWTFQMDNQLTQAALLTSAAFLLNESTSYSDDGSSIGQDMTRGVILSTGLLLMADRLARGFDVKFGRWDIPE